jgi:hypothetical protein
MTIISFISACMLAARCWGVVQPASSRAPTPAMMNFRIAISLIR